MNTQKQACLADEWSARAVGFIILPIALILGFFSILLGIIFGLFFALPLLFLSLLFIFAPEGKMVCQLILNKKALDTND